MDGTSLFWDGAWARVRRALGLSRKSGRPVVATSVGIGVFLWLALLGLSLVGPGGGSARLREVLHDYGVAVRLLLAIPILLLDEYRVDRRISLIIPTFLASNLLAPDGRAAWEERLRTAKQRVTNGATLLVLAAVTLALAIATMVGPRASPSMQWMADPSGPAGLTWSGLWYVLIARSVFLFLGLLWLWRWITISLLIYRTSRAPLLLQVSHPDRLGGLAIFTELVTAAIAIVFTASAVISAEVYRDMAERGTGLRSFAPILIAFLVLAVLFALGPFFSFVPLLGRLRRRALYLFGVLSAHHSALFEDRWFARKNPPDQQLLGAPEISSLTDLASAYFVASSVRIFPFGRGAILSVVITAAIPMIPVILLEVPLPEILSRLAKFLM